ncbi:STAS domain-containing protein [Nocardia sp. NPDC050406]|uniref:STAS domain-containing protein n=1 Tax=Nocardia sp. NPDC050406 TaxID=3364318 RepID=UPI003793B1B5
MPLHKRRAPGRIANSERPTLGAASLRTRHRAYPGATVVDIEGDVDLNTAGEWRAALEVAASAAAPGSAVIANLAHLGFLGSAGIHVLVDTQSLCGSLGQTLCLTDVPEVVAWHLSVVGLDIPRFPDIDTALRTVGRHT